MRRTSRCRDWPVAIAVDQTQRPRPRHRPTLKAPDGAGHPGEEAAPGSLARWGRSGPPPPGPIRCRWYLRGRAERRAGCRGNPPDHVDPRLQLLTEPQHRPSLQDVDGGFMSGVAMGLGAPAGRDREKVGAQRSRSHRLGRDALELAQPLPRGAGLACGKDDHRSDEDPLRVRLRLTATEAVVSTLQVVPSYHCRAPLEACQRRWCRPGQASPFLPRPSVTPDCSHGR